MTTSIEEAERLARKLRPGHYNSSLRTEIDANDLKRLCDFILSGDYKREIERAALERAAQICRDQMDRTTNDQRIIACNCLLQAIRAIIPAAPAKE